MCKNNQVKDWVPQGAKAVKVSAVRTQCRQVKQERQVEGEKRREIQAGNTLQCFYPQKKGLNSPDAHGLMIETGGMYGALRTRKAKGRI